MSRLIITPVDCVYWHRFLRPRPIDLSLRTMSRVRATYGQECLILRPDFETIAFVRFKLLGLAARQAAVEAEKHGDHTLALYESLGGLPNLR